MSRVGFRRMAMGTWHLRVVEDRGLALEYLSETWGPRLPESFYRWLRDGPDGSTYLLTKSVWQPERWVHGPASEVVEDALATDFSDREAVDA